MCPSISCIIPTLFGSKINLQLIMALVFGRKLALAQIVWVFALIVRHSHKGALAVQAIARPWASTFSILLHSHISVSAFCILRTQHLCCELHYNHGVWRTTRWTVYHVIGTCLSERVPRLGAHTSIRIPQAIHMQSFTGNGFPTVRYCAFCIFFRGERIIWTHLADPLREIRHTLTRFWLGVPLCNVLVETILRLTHIVMAGGFGANLFRIWRSNHHECQQQCTCANEVTHREHVFCGKDPQTQSKNSYEAPHKFQRAHSCWLASVDTPNVLHNNREYDAEQQGIQQAAKQNTGNVRGINFSISVFNPTCGYLWLKQGREFHLQPDRVCPSSKRLTPDK